MRSRETLAGSGVRSRTPEAFRRPRLIGQRRSRHAEMGGGARKAPSRLREKARGRDVSASIDEPDSQTHAHSAI